MSRASTAGPQRDVLLRVYEEAYRKSAWHGPNLRGSIRRVSATQAARRPGRGRHNIAEITVHCAYWKYTLRRRIRGDKRGSFALKGSNWFKLPSRPSDGQWREYVALLDSEHNSLLETRATTLWSRMSAAVGSDSKLVQLVYGAALHDTYHAGQVQLLKALLKPSS